MKCLFVRPPFAGWIVDGVKTIEYRSKASNIRGRVGIIQSMSGTVIGDVEIVGCNWNEKIQCYEWSLANARRYKRPLVFSRSRVQSFGLGSTMIRMYRKSHRHYRLRP